MPDFIKYYFFSIINTLDLKIQSYYLRSKLISCIFSHNTRCHIFDITFDFLSIFGVNVFQDEAEINFKLMFWMISFVSL